jgi:hypothetical protein
MRSNEEEFDNVERGKRAFGLIDFTVSYSRKPQKSA